VSAFLSNVNTRRPVEEYIEFGKHFLKILALLTCKEI
jgi:hypothetical protein